MRPLVCVLGLSLVALLLLSRPAYGLESSAYGLESCEISVSAQPPIVNFPSGSLPGSEGLTFGEILYVNYSSGFINRTITLEYANGSRWMPLQTFRGNPFGFNEIDVGLNSAWAHFGDNTIRAVADFCTSNQAFLAVRPDPTAVGLDASTYAIVAALLLLFIVLGRRVGWKRFVWIALAAYLALAPFTGQRYDVYFLLSSGIRMLQHVNPFDAGNPPVYPGSLKWAYPPLYAVYSAFAFLVYQLVTGASLPAVSALTYPGWLTSTYNVWQAYVPPDLPVLVLLLKLPMIGSAVLTGFLVRKMTGSGKAAVLWIANPLVILVAAVWGQLDPIATLLAVAALYEFEKGKQYHAYLLASFGAAVKVWPALIIPLMLVVSMRRDGRRALKPLTAVLPAVLLTLTLYAVYGNLLDSIFVFLYARGIPIYAGQFAVNGLTWQQALLALNLPPVPVFLYVGIPLYVVMLGWMYWRRDEDVTKWLSVSILLFYLTYNYVNPQYFYWILPLLILQRRKLAALAITALPLVFMTFAYNIFYFLSPAVLPDQFTFGASVVEQLKVAFFYQGGALFDLLTAALPTIAYLLLMYSEIRHRRGADGSGMPGGKIESSSAA